MCLLAPCLAAEPAASTNQPPTPTAKPKQSKAPASGSKPALTAKPATKTVAAKPAVKNPLRSEAEMSGFTSESSDQLYGRLNFTKITPQRKWWVKTGGGLTISRTFTKTKTQESQISSFNLDAQYRRDSKNGYRFLSATSNIKNRKPHTSSQYDQAGYYMFAAGYGKTIWPGMDCEIALAQFTQQRGDVDRRITPVYTLRMRSPLTSSLTLDSDTHLVEPWTEDNLVDSRVNLTYKLTSAMSMRFTYIANNILGGTLVKSTTWDKSFRVSLVFSR